MMLGKPAVDLGVRDVCRCGIRPWLQTAVAFWERARRRRGSDPLAWL